MTSVSDILKLKQTIERMQEDKHKAEGALEQVMNQIQTEFDCKTLEEAEKLVHKMQKQNKKEKQQITQETERLEKEIQNYES
jgi:hypothetical protein